MRVPFWRSAGVSAMRPLPISRLSAILWIRDNLQSWYNPFTESNLSTSGAVERLVMGMDEEKKEQSAP
ncbi:hypothetical protein GDO78_016531 [Eleutherodactylus coqui]|uniref:Uncharacterized protein n=1 Tax=Eleutherodactylus coqui TaxID=57060 RepID=A0A8J6JYK3_ELECQ|nr:hypothetical protein GDO78_016531 [Eleutherodactylus coqui]